MDKENDGKKIRFTKRMMAIEEMVGKCKTLADIGTDHALLPINLVLSGKVDKAYACDINEGPLEVAKKNIEKYSLKGKVFPILSDGLKNVPDCETVVIAGMGGETIKDILLRGEKHKAECFVFQPMNRADKLREALSSLSLKIVDECLCESEGRIYPIIKAVLGKCDLTPLEILAGPYIIKKKGPYFEKYIEKIIKYEKSKAKGSFKEHHLENVALLSTLI